jgi:hypothetical protein
MIELLDAALPALGILAFLLVTVAIVAVVSTALIAVPRSRAVGGRARDHAVLLASLPSFSHPDAAGHSRSRAPGRVLAVA